MAKLPPLNEVDKDLHLGFSEKVELEFKKCKHDLYLVSSTEARCKKCSVGFTGHDILRLVKASQDQQS